MLMHSLDDPKQETNSDNEYIDDYIEINSDDET